MPTEEKIVHVYDDQGRKLPYSEFKQRADDAGMTGYQRAKIIHQRRSARARVADRSFRAVDTRKLHANPMGIGEKMDNTRALKAYYAAPNRVDIENIDTTAERYKAERTQRAAESFEQGGIIEGVVELERDEIKATHGDDFAGAFIPQGYRQNKLGGNEIQLAKGIADREETLAHELGHALDTRLAGWLPGDKFGFSEVTEDPEYAEQIREASEERRGRFSDRDEYRSRAREQFADWFVGAVQEPRHTKATRGRPWDLSVEQAREGMAERAEKLVETPRNAAKYAVREGIREAATDADPDYDSDRVWNLEAEAREEAHRRFEEEGHRERMEERISERQSELEAFDAANVVDFTSLRLGNVHIEDDPLFEGTRRADLVPENTVRQIEGEMGVKLDIPGLS